jgi:hypothetical protein
MGTVPKFATSAADGLVRASVRLAAQRGEVGVTHEMLVVRRRAGLCDRSTRFPARLYA